MHEGLLRSRVKVSADPCPGSKLATGSVLPSLAGAGRYADLSGPSSVFANPEVGGIFNAGRRKNARVTTKWGDL